MTYFDGKKPPRDVSKIEISSEYNQLIKFRHSYTLFEYLEIPIEPPPITGVLPGIVAVANSN